MSIFDKLSTFKNRYKELLQETQDNTEWKEATSDASIMPDVLNAATVILEATECEYRMGYNGYGWYSKGALGGTFLHK